MEGDQRVPIQLEQRVSVQHEKRLPVKEGLHLFNTASRAQDDRLVGILDPKTESRAVAERLFDHGAKVMKVDHYLLKAVPFEQQQVPHNQRRARNRQERLRHDIGQRPEPGPEPRCKDHGLHNRKCGMLNYE